MKVTKFTICFLLFFSLKIDAQQDPQYTQYMYNFNIVNPAYAGIGETMEVGLLFRSQWSGFDGAPKTLTASAHSNLNTKTGIGVSLITEEIGPVRETNLYTDFSYTVNLSSDVKLAFGIKAGLTFHDIGLNDLFVIDDGDPFFSENINETTPNIGTGVYLYKPYKYYASLSMPNILEATHLDSNGNKIGSEIQHVFAAFGYVFDLSENYKLKPHTLVKFAFDAPASFDLNANVFMYNLVEVGIGYRFEDSFSGMVNFNVTPKLKIGYAYDNIISNLNIVTNSSHEVFLKFTINNSKRVISPRYF